MSEAQVRKEKLVTDFKAVVADAPEELLKLTAGQTGDKVADVRATSRRLTSCQIQRVQDLPKPPSSGKTKGRRPRATDDYVDQPWKAVGVAAGVGFPAEPAGQPPLSATSHGDPRPRLGRSSRVRRFPTATIQTRLELFSVELKEEEAAGGGTCSTPCSPRCSSASASSS